MKKSIGRLIILFILFTMAAPVSMANSGPVYMREFPSFNIVALEDCPIIVVSEALEFDFSVDMERMNWSPPARVTASYRMQNPTQESKTITMAFPSVMGLLESERLTKITVDGVEIPFTMRHGEPMSHTGRTEYLDQFRQTASMENILKQLNNEPDELRNFDKNGIGTLYRFSLSKHHERLGVIVSFSLDSKRTKVVVLDFSGYSVSEDGKIELFNWFESDGVYGAEAWMLVLGEDTVRDLQIEAYEGYKENPVRDAGVVYEKEIVEINSFLSEQIARQISRYQLDILNVNDFEAPIYHRLDEWFEYNQIVTLDDAVGVIHEQHLVVFLYDVTFPPDSMTEVTVQYVTDGTMDRRNSRNPMYAYAYISNPARGFAGFGSIDVVIRPPAEAPYLISSTWPFEKGDEGIYTASFDALPDDDLLFTLYWVPVRIGQSSLIIGGIILLIGAAVIIVIRKLKSKGSIR